MKVLVFRLGLWIFPKRGFTWVMGALARHSVSRFLIPWYIRRFRIDVHQAALPIHQYGSLLDFFTRSLHPGARPVAKDGMVSPVDGMVSQLGLIRDGSLLQAKGIAYTLGGLLGSEQEAELFDGGQFITLYLSPSDYHRIHMPLSGNIGNWRYIPGSLYPVNRFGVNHIRGIFSKNERLVTYWDSARGRCAMVMVGAAGVGSVRTAYGPERASRWRRAGVVEGAASLYARKGDEIGRFEFGSTVILVLPSGLSDAFVVEQGDSVRMGQTIAIFEDVHEE